MSSTTNNAEDILARWHENPEQVKDELIEAVSQRLSRIARASLPPKDGIRKFYESGDLAALIAISLREALDQVQPTSVSHFFNLLGQHASWRKVDLGRKAQRRRAEVTFSDPAQLDIAAGETPSEIVGFAEALEQLRQALGEEGWKVLLTVSSITDGKVKPAAELLQMPYSKALNHWNRAVSILERLY